MQKSVNELKPHPKSIEIYGNELIDRDLLSSIRENGVLVPLTIKPDGVIISGHRRYFVAKELGIKTVPVSEINYPDELSERIAIIEFNRQRKKTASQRQREADEIELIEKELANRRRGARTDLVANLPPSEFGKTREKVADKIGMKPRSYAKEREVYEAAKSGDKLASDLLNKLDKEEISIDKAYKTIRKEEKKKERQENSKKFEQVNINIDLRLGDFKEVLSDIPDGSVDLILTDPPYPKEYIECWSELSKFASEKLKSNGFCIAYSGQLNIQDVMKRMSENLEYYWMISLLHAGSRQLINPRNLFCGWKPILIYQKGIKKVSEPFDDFINGSGMEKTHHRWQQAVDELGVIIKKFTVEGDLIVDPFAGSGTTLIAAKQLKRNPVGAEIDNTEYNIAKGRIGELF
jgi:DNA modification methylase/ParB-like chromosome segregation protein Spo0J